MSTLTLSDSIPNRRTYAIDCTVIAVDSGPYFSHHEVDVYAWDIS